MRISTLPLVALLCGCPGSIDNPGLFTGDVTCEQLVDYYIDRSCLAGCHSAAEAAGELDLETQPVGKRLAGAEANDPACDGQLVVPEAPETSILYRKLTATPPCGNRMPLFAHPATQKHLDCVLEWIALQAGE